MYLDESWQMDGEYGKSDPIKMLASSLQGRWRKGQNLFMAAIVGHCFTTVV